MIRSPVHIILMAMLPMLACVAWAERFPSQAEEYASESSSMPRHEAFEGDPIPLVPPENSGSHRASQELTAGIRDKVKEDSSEEIGELLASEEDFPLPPSIPRDTHTVLVDGNSKGLGYYERLKIYLAQSWKSNVEYGKAFLDRREYASKYGQPNATQHNILVLKGTELAIRIAEEKRSQRYLADQIAQDEQLRLYEESLLCLALNGYYEARGETADQEVATAAVVLNRLSVGYRDATTICEVITTPKQFSWVGVHGINIPNFEDKVEKRAWERSLLIARRMMDPDATYIDPSNGATMYYNPDVANPNWAPDYNQVAILGNHRFLAEQESSHKYFINNRNVRINPVLFNGLSHSERDELKKTNSQQQKV